MAIKTNSRYVPFTVCSPSFNNVNEYFGGGAGPYFRLVPSRPGMDIPFLCKGHI